ncbi:MAG: DNA-directed RNA polymerase subunit H [Thermoplasmatota archaeon]
MPKFNVMENYLVPRHTIISEDQIQELLESYGIGINQLPKILMMDPCAKALNAKPGDVIKVERQSPTAGTSLYYRLVVEERTK